jgi:hypothetical protein
MTYLYRDFLPHDEGFSKQAEAIKRELAATIATYDEDSTIEETLRVIDEGNRLSRQGSG